MTSCIESPYFKGEKGYAFRHIKGKCVGHHRQVYADHHGVTLESIKGKVVRHTCDNPPCIEPSHLIIGTHQDNSDDMIARGRQNGPKGERSGSTVLTDQDVTDIFHDNRVQKVIASDYGIAQGTVSHIKTGKTWQHLGLVS